MRKEEKIFQKTKFFINLLLKKKKKQCQKIDVLFKCQLLYVFFFFFFAEDENIDYVSPNCQKQILVFVQWCIYLSAWISQKGLAVGSKKRQKNVKILMTFLTAVFFFFLYCLYFPEKYSCPTKRSGNIIFKKKKKKT